MSLTSYRAAPPRGGLVGGFGAWKTWRRPTFPRLGTQYHRRWGFSRPSSGWDRVQTPRHGHQVIEAPGFSGEARKSRPGFAQPWRKTLTPPDVRVRAGSGEMLCADRLVTGSDG